MFICALTPPSHCRENEKRGWLDVWKIFKRKWKKKTLWWGCKKTYQTNIVQTLTLIGCSSIRQICYLLRENVIYPQYLKAFIQNNRFISCLTYSIQFFCSKTCFCMVFLTPTFRKQMQQRSQNFAGRSISEQIVLPSFLRMFNIGC